jgi:hypothetical protein
MPLDTIADQAAARLRTIWPMLVGHAAALLLVHAAPALDTVEKTTGYRPSTATVTLVVGMLLGWIVYETGRILEAVTGEGRAARIARAAGRWILSVGIPTGQPTYK